MVNATIELLCKKFILSAVILVECITGSFFSDYNRVYNTQAIPRNAYIAFRVYIDVVRVYINVRIDCASVISSISRYDCRID